MNPARNIHFRRLHAAMLAVCLWLTTFVPLWAANAHTPTQQIDLSKIPAAKPRHVRVGRPAVNATSPRFHFSSNPSDREISGAPGFVTPLEPMSGAAVPGENQQLAAALNAFSNRKNSDDLSSLKNFLSAHPNSRWSASVRLILASAALNSGYLSDSLELFKSAWDHSKGETTARRKSVADAAISRLMILEAQLGMVAQLKSHLQELKSRSFLGADATRVHIAEQSLRMLQTMPAKAYKCGPFALRRMLAISGKTDTKNLIDKFASTAQGTNLAQLQHWAQQLGMKFQAAKRLPGAPVIVPSIMHWRVGHFTAITAAESGKYRLDDTTFNEMANVLRVSKQAIDSQSDGYFLVPAGKLPAGWQPVSHQQAASVWGKGTATSPYPATYPGSPNNQPSCPAASGGMAQTSVWSEYNTQNIFDNVLHYRSAIGPDMNFRANYTDKEYVPGRVTAANIANLGPNWSFNWVSYLSYDDSNDLYVMVPGGGCEYYYNWNTTTAGTYLKDQLSHCAMVQDTAFSAYRRLMPDGSVQYYDLPDSVGGDDRIFMSKWVDRFGNATTIQWASTVYPRVQSVTDALGQVTTFTYASDSTGSALYYIITSITDPFNRSATFSYDSSYTNLLSITDCIGLVSSFTYTTVGTDASFISAMNTPYGTTLFTSYTPTNNSVNWSGGPTPVGLKVTLPDGSSTQTEQWMGEQLQTFYWDRDVLASYPSDPANGITPINYPSGPWHCTVTQWQII
ncbi:MAG: cysteine peptidase family C39 domain-containing protein, partial [Candidatus Saccharimonadales bacterium]